MTFDDFISKFEKPRKTVVGFLVRCPSHDDSTASLQICKAGDGKILVKCFAGCPTESVMGAMGLKLGDLFPDRPFKAFTPYKTAAPIRSAPEEKAVIDKIYSYQNALGEEAYQALRMKPKSFRQRHKFNGEWVWKMDGVERFLYHLPQVLEAKQVWVCEGEKDVENLRELGFVATCNVGGAGKWLDGYTASLAGKDIVLCGDNDDAGRKHIEMVFDSIAGTAKTVRIVKLPNEIKDVSDYIATFKQPNEARAALQAIHDTCHPFVKGNRMPLYTMAEIEPRYARHAALMREGCFDLGQWLPTLGRLRQLVAGELVFILGDTGAGKTGLLSGIARAAQDMPRIMFELELPEELMFERMMAATTSMDCALIEEGYRAGETMPDILDRKFNNLLICSESKLTLEDLENYIIRAELKLGCKPKMVLIDYIQLLGGGGTNRRERVSDIAEGLKVLAKSTRTIIIVASQIRRPDEKDPQIGLHSGKESGSIENSCGLLLGAWRDSSDPTLLHLRVLKSTKGGAGLSVECNFDGPKMKITERVKTWDVPTPTPK